MRTPIQLADNYKVISLRVPPPHLPRVNGNPRYLIVNFLNLGNLVASPCGVGLGFGTMKFPLSPLPLARSNSLLGSCFACCLGSLIGSSAISEAVVPREPAQQKLIQKLSQGDRLSNAQIDGYQQQGRWLGPNWWANRLHDWQRTGQEGAIIECTPNRPFLGWRVAHDMSRQLDLSEGELDLSLQLAMQPGNKAGAAKPLSPNSLVGFLVGTGHSLENPMTRAMIFDFKIAAEKKKAAKPAQAVKGQKFPAVPGSGIAIGVSGAGKLRIIDLDRGQLLAEAKLSHRDQSTLRVSTKTTGDSVTLTVSAEPSQQTDSKPVIISADIPAARFKGGVALLSHPGSKSKKHSSLNASFSGYQAKSGFRKTNNLAVGPIVAAQYSVDRGVLKLSAQCMPQSNGTIATLSFYRQGKWHKAASAKVHKIDQLALFRVDAWNSQTAVPYQVSIPLAGSQTPATYTGMIAAEPTTGQVRLAALGCIIHRPWGVVKNWNEVLYFPHHDLQKRVTDQQPDLVFFYGDQMYESTPSPVDRNNYFEDYLYKWIFHCMAFKEMVRNVPSATIPDDHDVYQGNYWGEGGRKAPNNDWNNGGYLHPGEFIAQVHRTQTSHLPDAAEPDCLEQGIPAYHCDWNWAGVSFAILGDRYFKSGPAGHGLPKSGTNRPDHYNNPEFDTADLDLPGLQLLGEPQERFLAEWAGDWSSGAQIKAVLSQSPFGNFASHHAGTYLIADLDSNGWPQSGRNRALSIMRAARSVHIAGDQHLSTLVQHGIEKHNDAIFGFTAPAVANAYARAYYPALKSNYYRAVPPTPEQYLGERLDGFKNKATFHAVANPNTHTNSPYTTDHQPQLNQQVPGFGIIDFDTRAQTITFHSLPRSQQVADKLPGGEYPGWPLMVKVAQNDGRPATGTLARVEVSGKALAVVRVYGPDKKLQWAQRINQQSFTVPAYASGKHRIEIGDGEGQWQSFAAEPQDDAQAEVIKVNLTK